jgi:hypothetical protein
MSQLVTVGLQGGGGGGNQNATIQAVTNLLQNAGPGVSNQASMLTDRSGRFAFSNLPRGRYTVWVQRFNYYGPLLNGFPSSTASSTVSFDPSNAPAPIDLYLTQGLAITGRVLDPRGQPPPAPAWSVTAYRATFNEGTLVWAPILSRPLDDRGEYRLSPLAPGDYYVGVTPPANASSPAGQDPPIRTFFPGVTEPTQATRLSLKISDVPNVDFSIRTAPRSAYRISGIALNPTAVPNAAGIVDRAFNTFVLMPVDTHLIDSFTPSQFVNTAPPPNRMAGEFEIRNVRPGHYEIYPLPTHAGFPLGRTLVDVRNADTLGINLPTNPIVTLQGQVAFPEQTSQRAVRLDMVRMVLRQWNAPPVRSAPLPGVPVSSTGEFSLTAPARTVATLQVSGLPEEAFVSDIRIGNTSVFNTGFESVQSEPLQVIIDAVTSGTVETIVQGVDGRPGPRANVVLIPSEDRRQNPIGYKTGITDVDGRLTLRGVRPGVYTAFAWESIPETAWLNKEFLSKYQQRGTPVTVAPGARINVQLKSIPFDSELR